MDFSFKINFVRPGVAAYSHLFPEIRDKLERSEWLVNTIKKLLNKPIN